MEIRRCSLDDFEHVFPLLQQLWPQKTLHGETVRELFSLGIKSPNVEYLCAVVDSRIIGFCSMLIKYNLWQEGRLAHIDELVVDERFRGQGVGSRLVEAMTAAAQEKECKKIELDTAFHKEDSHRFYKHLGFENRAFLFSKNL
jgi:ribosomal protein S18 acetylase RimI-like enzyme